MWPLQYYISIILIIQVEFSNGCFIKKMAEDSKCLVACFGLYADLTYINSTEMINLENAKDLSGLQQEYNEYKNKYLENVIFDSWSGGYSGKFVLNR